MLNLMNMSDGAAVNICMQISDIKDMIAGIKAAVASGNSLDHAIRDADCSAFSGYSETGEAWSIPIIREDIVVGFRILGITCEAVYDYESGEYSGTADWDFPIVDIEATEFFGLS